MPMQQSIDEVEDERSPQRDLPTHLRHVYPSTVEQLWKTRLAKQQPSVK